MAEWFFLKTPPLILWSRSVCRFSRLEKLEKLMEVLRSGKLLQVVEKETKQGGYIPEQTRGKGIVPSNQDGL